MNDFFNQNNDPYNLVSIVINKLNQMNSLLQQGKITESIDLTHNIALILRSLKQNQRMIWLNQHMIQNMSDQLSNIDVKLWRDKVKKEQLENFFHNLQHIDDITDFNYMAMLRMKSKEVEVNNKKTFKFQLKPIGLENVGATCYMNATLQALGQIPELRDFFLYGPPRQEYDNRFINLINCWMLANVGWTQEFGDDDFNRDNKDHIQKLRKFCIERLEKIKPKNNQWDNNAIEELKLILKCFPDTDFYKVLLDKFGEKVQGVDIVTKLPEEAIDIGYEFFLVLKNIDELEKSGTGKQYYKPNRFKDFLSIVNPLFKGIAANDSKDLVVFLYETWHKIYNKAKGQQTVTNALKLNSGIYANINIAQDIQKHLSNIENYLKFLFINKQQHDQALDNIKQFANAIMSCIEKAALDQQCKEYLENTINNIISDICATQNINCIPTLTQKLQWFSNMAYCSIAPSPDTQEFQNFLCEYFGQNGSILTDHFYHIQTNIIKCQDCNAAKTSYNMYNIIIFPLMKVYQSKNQCLQNNGQMINISGTEKKIVTIQDCFRQISEPEVLNGQNQIYCNSCHKLSDAFNINKLHSLPQKMTLIFNRGKGLEFDVDIEHADYIDPFDILEFDPANYQCFHWINVRANLLHLGSSDMGGHFISAVRSEKDNKPRTYNDAMVNDRDKMEAGVQYGQKEMSYVWFTDTIALHLEIDTILEKVKNDQFRGAICAKFLSLGVLDAQEQNPINKKRQMVFAYLLMYAFEKCMANKNLVYNQYGQLNQDKAQNFDKYLSDFICDAFSMIATWDNFKFDEKNCQVTINQIREWRQNILNCAQNASYVPNAKVPVQFDVYKENMIMDNNSNNINDVINLNKNIQLNMNNKNIININSNVHANNGIIMKNQNNNHNIININSDLNNNIQLGINNNNHNIININSDLNNNIQLGINNNNHNIINNDSNNINTSVLTFKCTLKFTFNGQTFSKTIDDADHNSQTIQDVFNDISGNNNGAFWNYKNVNIKLDSQPDMASNAIFAATVQELCRYTIDGTLNFIVSGERVLQYDSDANKFPKYNPNNRSGNSFYYF